MKPLFSRRIPMRHGLQRHAGFSLIEIAIVLLIMSVLLGGALVPLSARMQQQRIQETNARLAKVQEALFGFVASHGRLPCPANGLNGEEWFKYPLLANIQLGGECAVIDGFVPALTLGLTPVDESGFMMSAWGDLPAQRLRYAVADIQTASANHVLTTGTGTAPFNGASMYEMVNVLETESTALKKGALSVCTEASSTKPYSCKNGKTLSKNAVVVIYSPAQNTTPRGPDEEENQDSDQYFVSRTYREATDNPNLNFDDQVTWIGASQLFQQLRNNAALK